MDDKINATLKKDVLELLGHIEQGQLGKPEQAVIVLHRDEGDSNRLSLCQLGQNELSGEKICEILAQALGRHIRELKKPDEDFSSEHSKLLGATCGRIMELGSGGDEGHMLVTALMLVAAFVAKHGSCCEPCLEKSIGYVKNEVGDAARAMWKAVKLHEADGEGETKH